MEEPKAPSEVTQELPQQPPQAPSEPSLPPENQKVIIPSEYVAKIQDSNYYKMRSIIKDLRSQFLEVLRTPDFRNCKASLEIQTQMKVLMELYKEITAGTVPTTTDQNLPKGAPMNVENGTGVQQQAQVKFEGRNLKTCILSDKQRPEDGEGRRIVGGSAFGWNFITYSNSKPVYSGVTKESFRSSNKMWGSS